MIKVVIVTSNAKELERHLNNGYSLIGGHPYEKGIIFILKK